MSVERSDSVATTLDVTLKGETSRLSVDAGQTLLEAVQAAGLAPLFSCRSGVCGTCEAKLVSGRVSMMRCVALIRSEIDAGAILTCQSLAQTDKVSIDYGY